MHLLKYPFVQVFLIFVLTISHSPFLNAQQLFINEILASNSNVNADENGEYDDWVELYNGTATPVDVGGMYLTDNLTNLNKWQIPANQPSMTTIAPYSYLLIWCDDQATQGPLHAPFKLSASGEEVALVATNGVSIVDSHIFGGQSSNTSLGREGDGQYNWVIFANPTPNAANGGVGSTIADMPVASHNGGHYNNDFTLSLTTTTPNATIRYTTDGSEPTSSSSIYSGPIQVDDVTVLRARTFKTDWEPSRTMTHTYLFGIDHEFPIFCLSTDHAYFFDSIVGIYTNWEEQIEQPVHVELYEADGSFGFRQDLGVQIHGKHSQTYPQKGLAFRARNQYGNNKINYTLFPDLPYDEYGAFLLRASGNDYRRTLFRDAMASSLLRDMSDIDPLIKKTDMDMQGYRPAIVYLNGEYFGIHNLREKMDYRYLRTHYGIEKDAADIVANKSNVEHGEDDAWDDFFDFIEEADFEEAADLTELKANIDLDHFLDYFLFNIFIDNNDWPSNNNRRWRLRQDGEKWRFFVYDLDVGFGLGPLSDDYNSGDWESMSVEMVMSDTQSTSHNKPHSTLLLRKLMDVDTIRYKFINRMADMLNIMYPTDRIHARIAEFEAVYLPEIQQHSDFWWSTNDWDEDVDKVRLFSEHRDEEMFDQFEEYFTDDIDDVVDLTLDATPQAGGGIHLNTMRFYEDQFPWSGTYFSGIDVPLHAVANPGYTFTGWSPSGLGDEPHTTMHLNDDEDITAHFTLGSTQMGNIVINEINYHSPDDCDAGDWVELYNAGTVPVDLSGWFLEDGGGHYFNLPTNTTLAAGAFLVVVQDIAKFTTIHPQVTNFIGSFGVAPAGSFGLSSNGEWIAINNADRSFRDTVRYDDNLPWPLAADGGGPSLALYHPTLDNALAQSWYAYPIGKGSPGAPNQGTPDLGDDLETCVATTFVFDASYEPCFNCSYLWNTGATTPIIEVTPNQGTTVYSVTITDGSGTTQTDEVTIVSSNPYNLMLDPQGPVCHGDENGFIDLEVNGAGSYSYIWSNGASTQDIQDLPPGTYTVTVSNALSCTQTQTVVLTDPPVLNVDGTLSEILCYGMLNSIDLTVNGGVVPYNFLWSNGSTAEDPDGLLAGEYAVTVSDANGCSLQENYSFSWADPISVVADVDFLSCYGANDGAIEVAVSGGAGGFTYEWNTGAITNVINNIAEGVYWLTTTDSDGCVAIDSFVVEAEQPMSVVITPTHPTLTEAGAISVSAQGGSPPYSVLWSSGDTTFVVNDLEVGTYSFVITDAAGCIFEGTVELDYANAVSHPDLFSVAIYPNPADGAVFVESDQNHMAIDLVDLMGRTTRSFVKAGQDPLWRLDLDGLAPGVYFLRIRVEGEEVVRKLVLE